MAYWMDQFLEKNAIEKKVCLEMFSQVLTTLWGIWKARNCKIFDDKNPNPTEVLITSNANYGEFMSVKETSNPNPTQFPPRIEAHQQFGALLVLNP